MTFQTVDADPEHEAAYKAQIQEKSGVKPANCTTLDDFLRIELPVREAILLPWLLQQSLSMIYAWRGIGKSWLALCIAYAVACGGEILGWRAPTKRSVLYIDGELPAATLQERLAKIVNSFDFEYLEGSFKLITPDLQSNGIVPNLSDPIGRNYINEHAQDVDLIIVDNISTLVRGGKENEGESWLPVQEWALQHRSQGRSVLFIHHSGKGGQQRGTSRREDVLDTVISLRRPSDYDSTEGAKFELHFEKARNLTGDDALPLEVELCSDNNTITWKFKTASDALIDRIQVLAEDGATRQEIEIETGLSRYQITRLVKKADESGNKIILTDSRKKGVK